MVVEILAVTASDDTRCELRVQVPEGATQEVVVIMPAMGVAASKYDALATAMSANGFATAVCELRGIGSSSVRAARGTDFGYREAVEVDLPAAMAAVQQRFTGQRINLWGHSLGGQFACLYLAQHPGAAVRLILNASCTVDYRGWPSPKRYGLLAFAQLSGLLARVLGYYPGLKIGFAGTESRTTMVDWAYNARTGRYRICNSEQDYEKALRSLSVPVLTVNYQHDDLAPLAATNLLVSKMAPQSLQQIHLSADQLGIKRADHFSWLKSPDPVAKSIADWISATPVN